MNQSTSKTRRHFLASIAAAGALVPLMRISPARATALPHLDPNSSEANANHYVNDYTKVSHQTAPAYKPGSHCGSCSFYQGGTAQWGACPNFPGKDVHINGWCQLFTAKS